MLAGFFAKETITVATRTAISLCLAVLDLTVLTMRPRLDYGVK